MNNSCRLFQRAGSEQKDRESVSNELYTILRGVKLKRFLAAQGTVPMPIFAYFSCVGTTLLAFLFLTNAYLGPPRDIFRQSETNFPIRIKSSYPTPERVVFDTSIPTIVPRQQAQLDLASAPPVANAYASFQLPTPIIKKAHRTRVAKKLRVDVARLNTNEVSGLNYPPSW